MRLPWLWRQQFTPDAGKKNPFPQSIRTQTQSLSRICLVIPTDEFIVNIRNINTVSFNDQHSTLSTPFVFFGHRFSNPQIIVMTVSNVWHLRETDDSNRILQPKFHLAFETQSVLYNRTRLLPFTSTHFITHSPHQSHCKLQLQMIRYLAIFKAFPSTVCGEY